MMKVSDVASSQVFLKNILGDGFVRICLIFHPHPLFLFEGELSNLSIFRWVAQPSTGVICPLERKDRSAGCRNLFASISSTLNHQP